MARTCWSCRTVMPDSADRCEKCGYQFASDPRANEVERKLRNNIVLYVIIGGIAIAVFLKVGHDAGNAARESSSRYPVAAQVPAAASASLTVKHVITKAVDGKHRYFFDIRNTGRGDFTGDVRIVLEGKDGLKLAGDTFSSRKPISAGLGASEYIDSNTGPPSVHGESGVRSFTYEITDAGRVVGTGRGPISSRVE